MADSAPQPTPIPTIPTPPDVVPTSTPSPDGQQTGWKVIVPYTPSPGSPPAPKDEDLPTNISEPDGTPTSGVHGANRVFESPLGYGGISGKFVLPSSFDGGNDWKKDANGQVIGITNNSQKPTLYLGMKGGGVTIDAGLQYAAVSTPRIDAGWTIFERVSNGKYKSQNPPKWIYNDDNIDLSSGSVDISLSIASDGQVLLSPGPWKSFQPYWLKFSNPDIKSSYGVRRIIGITQSATSVNGSYMRGAGFVNGYITPIYNESGHFVNVPPRKWEKKLYIDPNTNEPNPKPDAPYRYGPTSPNGDVHDVTRPYPWIINFPNPLLTRVNDYNGSHPVDVDISKLPPKAVTSEELAATPAQLEAAELERYSTEFVDINMLQAPGNWKGNPHQRGKSKPKVKGG